MKKYGLTLSIIFEAGSANYGESFGNISELKKLTRGNGETYTYISRQAIRYNIVNQLGWDTTPVSAEGRGDKKVVQFQASTTIANYPEIDLFGYMKTVKETNATTRSAVVRLSNAISLEPFASDLEFLTNMGLSVRAEGKDINNNIAQSEIHRSYYAYTITVDLDRVGIDGDISISVEERVKRILLLIDAIQFLYRDIRGRRENLSPLFAIGGVYKRKTPYFDNRLHISKNKLNMDAVKSAIECCDDAKENTVMGLVEGIFSNDNEIKEKLDVKAINDFFAIIKKEVEAVYNEGVKG